LQHLPQKGKGGLFFPGVEATFPATLRVRHRIPKFSARSSVGAAWSFFGAEDIVV
jgi:hypothetical protein